MGLPTWGIVGLGWLGQSLSDLLQSLDYPVWGTHRTDFDFNRTSLFPEKWCDILLLNTPPLPSIPPQDYVSRINLKNSNSKIIFISSTSVFGENTGEISEIDLPRPQTESAKWLLKVENLLRDHFQDRLLIIRPGGLIGGNRHPIFSLIKSGEIINANHSINLIHRDDLCQLIILAASSNIQILNAVAPTHKERGLYYNEWAKKLNFETLALKYSIAPDRKILSNCVNGIYPSWICPDLNFL